MKKFTITIATVFYDNEVEGHGMFVAPGMVTFMQDNNIKFELAEWNGPSGFWPEIKFTADSKEKLEQLIFRYYNPGETFEEMSYFFEDITEEAE